VLTKQTLNPRPLFSGLLPAIRSNFSSMLLSSAIPSLIRQYQSTMARNIKNNTIQIAAATTATMGPFCCADSSFERFTHSSSV
jgi:hypothetical protein